MYKIGQPTITLTFDDGLDSQLDCALPLMDEAGLKGTFYVNISSRTFAMRAPEWEKAASNGHEIGNHTIFHPAVKSKKWVSDGNAIENYTLDRMKMELAVANDILHLLDGKPERTFAFPCSNPVLGNSGIVKQTFRILGLERTRFMGWINKREYFDLGSKEHNYTALVKEQFFAARCGGLPVDMLPPIPENRYQVKGVEGDGCSAEELLYCVDKAIEKNAWLVFVFHGIGGGHHLFCDIKAFEQLVNRLKSDERIVIKTFLDAAKEIWGNTAGSKT